MGGLGFIMGLSGTWLLFTGLICSFMVSGLFVPVLAGIFHKDSSNRGSFWSMITGGAINLWLILSGIDMPPGLNANIFGITLAALVYLFFHY